MKDINLIFEGHNLSPNSLPITPAGHCEVSSFVAVSISHYDILPCQRPKVLGPSRLAVNLESETQNKHMCFNFICLYFFCDNDR